MLTAIRSWVRDHPWFVLSLMLVLVVVAVSSATVVAAPPGEPITSEEQLLVDAVNAERAKRNLPPLTVNYSLMEAAWNHNEHMAKVHKLGHENVGDGTVRQRIEATGYRWRNYAENVAWGQRNVAEVMDAWMNSTGHRRNILGDFTDIGVAKSDPAPNVAAGNPNYKAPYWTQVFGVPVPPPGYVTVTPPTGHGRPCELDGDFDFDGAVTQADVDAVAAKFMTRYEEGSSDWDPRMDMIADGVINVFDTFEVVARIGTRCSQ